MTIVWTAHSVKIGYNFLSNIKIGLCCQSVQKKHIKERFPSCFIIERCSYVGEISSVHTHTTGKAIEEESACMR